MIGSKLARLLLLCCGAINQIAHADAPDIPLIEGLRFTSALATSAGDREGVVSVVRSNETEVTYSWTATQRSTSGEVTHARFERSVRGVDLASATRIDTVFHSEDRGQHPGYTAFTFSTAVYDALRTSGQTAFSVVSRDDRQQKSIVSLLDAIVPQTIRLKGTLTLTSSRAQPFPLLLNGQRVNVPALAVHGRFQYRDRSLEQDFLLLDQRSHPLVLRVVTGQDVYQIVRVDFVAPPEMLARTTTGALPKMGGSGADAVAKGSSDGSSNQAQQRRNEASAGGNAAPSAMAKVEESLRTTCRAELPGIYFEFAQAELTRESDATIAGLAELIGRHRDWRLSLEGHTDDIGQPHDNLRLSEARAAAVHASLTKRHEISPAALTTRGFGETRPVESNATLEGRARNRRVELVRDCQNANGARQ